MGASLLAFLSSMGTVVFGLGGATLLLFAHGDDGCVSKGAAPFCVLPMGACLGRVTGHLASTGQTTSTVFPPVCRPLMISGACRRLLPVPPRRVMPDRDITAPQSLAQAHWLARDRHGPHGCLSSKNNRGTLQDQKKYTLQHGAPASA